MLGTLYDPLLTKAQGARSLGLGAGGDRRRASDLSGTGSATNWFGIGYDAIHHKGRRSTPQARVLSEDLELRQLPRRNLTTVVRDLNRNFAIAGWMIRRHLDYVASFHFRSKTGIPALDSQIEAFMVWWSRRENCDSAGRHNLQRLMRMWEARRVIDGDVLLNRLASTNVATKAQGASSLGVGLQSKPAWHGTIQTIEGDRIQTFGGIPFEELGITDPTRVVNGVWIDPVGRDIGYMVFKRLPLWSGLQWDRMVPAQYADLHGYFDRIDQVRGISPLASAANTLRDVYEGFDYALVKAKVSQFLAVLFTRGNPDEVGLNEIRESEAAPESDEAKPRYDVDLGRGPLQLDLDPGDDAKILESQQPSTQFQDFSKIMIAVALKALDIPFSFFDEAHTNFSGAQLAKVGYVESAKIKQHDNRDLLDRITRWRLALAVADGAIALPAGMSVEDLRWQWSHAGMPWYDSLKEVSGAIAAINAGLSSTPREAQKLGLDAYEMLEEQAAFLKEVQARGMVLSTAIASIAATDPANSRNKTEAQNIEEENDEEKGVAPEDRGSSHAEAYAAIAAAEKMAGITATAMQAVRTVLSAPAPAIPAPIVNVNVPQQLPPKVTVRPAAAAVQVNLPQQPAPQVSVNVPAPQVRVEAPSVTVEAPPPLRSKSIDRFVRDSEGEIVEVHRETVPA